MSWSPSAGPRRTAPDPPPPKLQPSPPHLGSHVLLGRCGPRGRLRALCEVLGLRRECAARGQCRGPAGGRGGVGLSESGCRGGRSPRRPAPGGRGAWGAVSGAPDPNPALVCWCVTSAEIVGGLVTWAAWRGRCWGGFVHKPCFVVVVGCVCGRGCAYRGWRMRLMRRGAGRVTWWEGVCVLELVWCV